MANTFTSFNPEYWARDLQATLFVENTAVMLAGKRGRDVLSADGRKVHIPVTSKPSIQTYTPGSDLTDTDINSTDAELEVDTFKALSSYIDDVENKQSGYDHQSFEAMAQARMLNNDIEQAFLSEITNATHTVNGATLGSSGNLDLDTTNAAELFAAAHTKLDVIDAPMGSENRFAVVGAHTVGVLRNTKAGRESNLGDAVLGNGMIGPWQGWTVIQNNNLPYTAVLGLATNPSENDTITIAGVTFTFTAALASAGDLHIGSDVDATRLNAANAINAPRTAITEATDAGYTPVSDEDAFLLEKRGISASDSAGDDELTITGYGDIVVAETLTNATDAWASQKQNSWFGVRGATDLVVQLPIRTETTRVEKRFGTRVKSLAGYGKKTFADGARVLVNVELDAGSWV